MYRIIAKEALNPTVTRMVIDAPFVARKPAPDSLSYCAWTRTGNAFP